VGEVGHRILEWPFFARPNHDGSGERVSLNVAGRITLSYEVAEEDRVWYLKNNKGG
jgi:hypothetical protein